MNHLHNQSQRSITTDAEKFGELSFENRRITRQVPIFVPSKRVIGPFVSRLREQPGKDIWLMGGGYLIASFLDEQAIDEFVVFDRSAETGDWCQACDLRFSVTRHRCIVE